MERNPADELFNIDLVAEGADSAIMSRLLLETMFEMQIEMYANSHWWMSRKRARRIALKIFQEKCDKYLENVTKTI